MKPSAARQTGKTHGYSLARGWHCQHAGGHTLGAYVEPGKVVAGIVPTADTLLIEAKISPRDVAFVRRGQPAIVKITAYDFSIFGGLVGEVTNVSADSIVEKEKGEDLLHCAGEDRQIRAGTRRKILSHHSGHGCAG